MRFKYKKFSAEDMALVGSFLLTDAMDYKTIKDAKQAETRSRKIMREVFAKRPSAIHIVSMSRLGLMLRSLTIWAGVVGPQLHVKLGTKPDEYQIKRLKRGDGEDYTF